MFKINTVVKVPFSTEKSDFVKFEILDEVSKEKIELKFRSVKKGKRLKHIYHSIAFLFRML
jgi:hypothetical protein